MKRLMPILAMFAYMWGTILLISFIIFKLVANMPEVFPRAFEPFATSTLKVVIGALLFIVWVFTSKAMVEGYVKRRLKVDQA